jgi:hypothetical protein
MSAASTAAARRSSRQRIESKVGACVQPLGWVVLVLVELLEGVVLLLEDVEVLEGAELVEDEVLDELELLLEDDVDAVVAVVDDVDVLVELLVGGTTVVVVVVGPVPVVVVTVDVLVVVGTTRSSATTRGERLLTSPHTRSPSGSTAVVTFTKPPPAEPWSSTRSFSSAPPRSAGS